MATDKEFALSFYKSLLNVHEAEDIIIIMSRDPELSQADVQKFVEENKLSKQALIHAQLKELEDELND